MGSSEKDDSPSAPFWMVTFSDLMMVLVVFFVMIVSMSAVEVEKFQEALSYFQRSPGILQDDAMMNDPIDTPFLSRQQAQQYESLLEYIQEEGLDDHVDMQLLEDGIHTSMTDSVMFNTAQADLIEPARTVLERLAGIVNDDIESIVVEGHTDSRPINTIQYPTNWELSTARASSVVRFLQQQEDALEPSQYVAIGYGEHQPIASNDTPDGRAANRRVEIFLSWTPWQSTTTPSPESPSEQMMDQPTLSEEPDS